MLWLEQQGTALATSTFQVFGFKLLLEFSLQNEQFKLWKQLKSLVQYGLNISKNY